MTLNHNTINLWETKLDKLNIATEKQSMPSPSAPRSMSESLFL